MPTRTLTGLVAGLLLMVVAMVSLPVSLFTGVLGTALPGVQLTPLGASRLTSGRALVSSHTGTDILRWRWCPAAGLRAFCVELSGPSGFVEAVVLPGWSGAQVPELDFARIDARTVAGDALPGSGLLRGELRGLSYRWRGDCLPLGWHHLTGDIVLSDPLLGEKQVHLAGDGAGQLQFSGDFLQGQLALGGDRAEGVVQVTLPTGPADIRVARRFACSE